MLLYATEAQLTAWLDGAPSPSNAKALLRSASLVVRGATIATVYTTDPAGLPSDAVVKQAFADATCAQVALWSTAGIDPAGGGVSTSAPVRSKKLGRGSVEYDTGVNSSVAAYNAKRAAAKDLCYEAWLILSQAGLQVGLYAG